MENLFERKALMRAFEKEPVIALIGQSACGKGTQIEQIINVFADLFPGKPYLCSESGQLLRDNIPHMSKWNKAIIDERQHVGKLKPWTMVTALWATKFFNLYQGGPIFVDGSPRSVDEVDAMLNLYCEYVGKDIIVFLLTINDEEAEQRLVRRHQKYPRPDTATVEVRSLKIAYYHTHVVLAVKKIADMPGATVYTINGMQPIEIITREILHILGVYHSN